jgi:hypothetical protein
MFSWELGGPNASLLGAGVAILGLEAVLKAGGGFVLGRELALVVSFKQEEVLGSGETLVVGEEDATPGDDFWKKETMDRCLADDEAPVGRLAAPPLAGVRAALLPALSPAMLLAGAGEARDAGEGQRWTLEKIRWSTGVQVRYPETLRTKTERQTEPRQITQTRQWNNNGGKEKTGGS